MQRIITCVEGIVYESDLYFILRFSATLRSTVIHATPGKNQGTIGESDIPRGAATFCTRW